MGADGKLVVSTLDVEDTRRQEYQFKDIKSWTIWRGCLKIDFKDRRFKMIPLTTILELEVFLNSEEYANELVVQDIIQEAMDELFKD